MTTYYHYGDGGLVGTSTIAPVSQLAYGYFGHGSIEHETDAVGAYLARRAMNYPAYVTESPSHLAEPTPQTYVHHHQYNNYVEPSDIYQGYLSAEGYDSRNHAGSSASDHASTMDYVGQTTPSAPNRAYPDPEHIRHLHTLHSLLLYIQPARKLNSLYGRTLDIIEQDTGIAFAFSVPKKLLVLFLGRQIVNKFMQTVEREDNENWRGGPTVQKLYLPRNRASKAAIKILVSWMARACQYHTMSDMKPIQIPRNTFVACSLAQTMELFGLYKDAARMDFHISKDHLLRPIFAVELESMWNCLGENTKYVYAAIKAVGTRLQEYEHGQREEMQGADEMLALLEQFPRLKARVRDLELNESYRPVFGTKWMRKLGNPTPSSESEHFRKPNGRGNFASSRQINAHTGRDSPENDVQPVDMTKHKRRVAVLRITAESTPVETQDYFTIESKTNHEEVEW